MVLEGTNDSSKLVEGWQILDNLGDPTLGDQKSGYLIMTFV